MDRTPEQASLFKQYNETANAASNLTPQIVAAGAAYDQAQAESLLGQQDHLDHETQEAWERYLDSLAPNQDPWG